MTLRDELQKLVKGEVLDDEETLKKYSRDYSIFEVRPQVVVFPKNAEDVKNVVLFVNKYPKQKLSVTARSGGTDMGGGPLNESIILDFSKHMNKLLKIGKDYALVQPGMFYRDFEKASLKKGLLFPSFPASRDICAIGGIVSNNSGGENNLVYGKTENYVLEYQMVLVDGKEYTFRPIDRAELSRKLKLKGFEGDIYRKLFKLVSSNAELLAKAKPRVSKNSAGYYLWNVWNGSTFNIPKLLVGAQGTLGITTQVKLKLIKPKEHSALVVIFMKDVKALGQLVDIVLEKKPETFEAYDDQTLKLALRFLPDFVKLLGAKNMLSLAWQFLPEFKMMLGGLPKLILLAEFTGDSKEEVQKTAKETQLLIRRFGFPTRVAKTQKESEKYFTIRRKSFSLLHSHAQGLFAAPFIDDVVVKPEHLPEFLPQLHAILKPYRKQMVYTIAGHAGDGNFHVIPLVDLSKPDVRAMIPEVMQKVHKLVVRYRGSITGEHNDGLIRTPYLKDMYGPRVVKLFEEVKDIFDPDNIFNPGKKVGGSLAFAIKHMITHKE
ncbi:MAG TPA: FAD-binding oxidoreductase [Candidatus Paceibacterota bacterium]|nr:FAD-binding oxidoreductase [Candidatus Paceibacterota bacterium]